VPALELRRLNEEGSHIIIEADLPATIQIVVNIM
jgi:hypothetical protein